MSNCFESAEVTMTESSKEDFITIEVVCSHQQLQTQFSRNFHVRHIFSVLVLLVVVEVLAHLLEHDATMYAVSTLPC